MTSHNFRGQANDMENMQTPEGKLIGDAQKRMGISARKAAEELGMSDTRWRNIVNGYQAIGRGDQIQVVAPAETLARMAGVVEVTEEELIAVGREDAAAELRAHKGRKLRPEVKDNRSELGRLMNEELEASGRGPVQIVGSWALSPKRAFYWWKDGTSAPSRKYRAQLEDALGWRRGVVTEILDAPITKTFTLSEVRDWSAQPKPGPVKARDLSTDELLMELTRRVGAMESELEALRPSPVSLGDNELYDLAASDEHVPGEDDND